ncbi:Protein of unknown function (DUF2809) [Xenococcus sp. PCC 7305]|uniref:ribosomal maturation YjgA family protein n=1 Tax=Xenococcus sp. PCC 7305 TaxID=102125 RepID=UPI0002ABDB05|nr:DUF2809 domain-containing protein [Xenococcus sp. PCC 7305]ELS02175.1 Protein of unknown function (DUF2809) [Xenococcus sp. PCC 7305]
MQKLSLTKRHFLVLLSLFVITPLGLLSKVYTGIGQEWINDYSGDILYEIFWCLVFFWFFSGKKAIAMIPLWVFVVTCAIELAQLYFVHVPVAIRSTIIWRLLLGSTFAWWDFPHYALGCFLGWLLLIQLNKLSR